MERRVCLLLLVLAIACGGSANTGSVTGAVLSDDGQMVTVVKMDDGREVHAVMPADSSGQVALVGGQRVQLEPMPNSRLWRVVRRLDKDKPRRGTGPAEPFEVAVKSTARQKKWTPPGGITGLVLTRGASVILVDGALSTFEADPGYDIAVVNLDIAINAADANLPLGKAVGVDAAGKEYRNLCDPAPLAKGRGQLRQFGFAVPESAKLAALRLSNGYTLKLSGK